MPDHTSDDPSCKSQVPSSMLGSSSTVRGESSIPLLPFYFISHDPTPSGEPTCESLVPNSIPRMASECRILMSSSTLCRECLCSLFPDCSNHDPTPLGDSLCEILVPRSMPCEMLGVPRPFEVSSSSPSSLYCFRHDSANLFRRCPMRDPDAQLDALRFARERLDRLR